MSATRPRPFLPLTRRASSHPRRSISSPRSSASSAHRREELLLARAERQERIAAGELPGFLESTRRARRRLARRSGSGRSPGPPGRDHRPAGDRKMVINAFNSGARVFMADFEDANSPTWENVVGGQQNLTDAIERTISLEQGEKRYALNDDVAVLLVRPRGWHLQERHVDVDGEHVSAGLFDFGVYLHRNAERLLERGSGPYFYLPKLESHLEARLWNDVFCFAQDRSASRAGRSRRRSSSRRSSRRSRWTRSSTSFASTRPGSTRVAGTTSSRSSRSSATAPSSCSPIACR